MSFEQITYVFIVFKYTSFLSQVFPTGTYILRLYFATGPTQISFEIRQFVVVFLIRDKTYETPFLVFISRTKIRSNLICLHKKRRLTVLLFDEKMKMKATFANFRAAQANPDESEINQWIQFL